MHESLLQIALLVGGALVVVAILWSTWLFERNSANYRKHLKRDEERQDQFLALLARQERLLERIEALVGHSERLAQPEDRIKAGR